MLKLMDLKEQEKKKLLSLRKGLLQLMKSSISINLILVNMLTFCYHCKEHNNTKMSEINISQFVNTTIDSFTTRPLYQIKVKSSGVNFDIRINDFPIFRFFGKSGGTNIEYPINNAILNSGKQILTIKIYPIKGTKKILPTNTFSLVLNKKNDAWVYDNQREIILTMPTMIVPNEGLPYWEYKTEFDVVVPYDLCGWKNSKKIDDIDVQKKILESYERLKNAIENKDDKLFIRLTKNKNEEEAISLYEKQEEDLIGFQKEREKVLPFDNCNIKFYGNGKLVRLETEDGESCLKTELIINGQKEIYYYPILFHMPQNSNELEIIR